MSTLGTSQSKQAEGKKRARQAKGMRTPPRIENSNKSRRGKPHNSGAARNPAPAHPRQSKRNIAYRGWCSQAQMRPRIYIGRARRRPAILGHRYIGRLHARPGGD